MCEPVIKSGHKVKVKEDLVVGMKYGHFTFVESMKEFCGKTAIVSTGMSRMKTPVCFLDIDEMEYYWSQEMLTRVPKYNVGDTITLREDLKLGIDYDNVIFGYSLLPCLGRNYTIAGIEEPFSDGNFVYVIHIPSLKCPNRYFRIGEEMIKEKAVLPKPTKYKVGDRVRIKSDLSAGQFYNYLKFTSGMLPMLGKDCVVKSVTFENYDGVPFPRYKMHGETFCCDNLSEAGVQSLSQYSLSDDMIEGLSSEFPKYKVGDEVMLRCNLKVGEVYSGLQFTSRMQAMTGMKFTIRNVEYLGSFRLPAYKVWYGFGYRYITDDMIRGLCSELSQKSKEKETKYKVGDIVVIRNDLVEFKYYGEEPFVPEMKSLEGKTYTIEHVGYGYGSVKYNFYYLEGDSARYRITDDMILGVPFDLKVKAHASSYKRKRLEEAARPLVELLKKEYGSQYTVLVENDFVTLRRDSIGVPFETEEEER